MAGASTAASPSPSPYSFLTLLVINFAPLRGLVGGVIFAGVGLGVAASGTIVPLLLQQGLKQAWYGLALLSAVLTLISWKAWPAEASTPSSAQETHAPAHVSHVGVIRALCVEYGLNALALVPHMVFLVDFVARGLGQGIAAGSHYWVLYGIGAIIGPLLELITLCGRKCINQTVNFAQV